MELIKMEKIEKKKHIKKCGLCQEKVIWTHGEKPTVCPLCDAIQWDKPKDECYLFNVQKKYIETKDKKYLGDMYERCFEYGKKIAHKMLSIKLDEEVFEERVQDAVTTFIMYYLRKENYCIEVSFGYQILKALQQQLYRKKQKNIDQLEMSYDTPIKDGEKTFKDKISEDFDDGNKYSNEAFAKTNKDYLINEISNFVDKVYNVIAENKGVESAILSMILLHNYINKKKDVYFESFYKYFGYEIKKSFELEKLVLLEFLEEMRK